MKHVQSEVRMVIQGWSVFPQRPDWYYLTKLPSCLPSLTAQSDSPVWQVWSAGRIIAGCSVSEENRSLWGKMQLHYSVHTCIMSQWTVLFIHHMTSCTSMREISCSGLKHVINRRLFGAFIVTWNSYIILCHKCMFFHEDLRVLSRFPKNNWLRAQTVITCTNGPFNLCSLC